MTTLALASVTACGSADSRGSRRVTVNGDPSAVTANALQVITLPVDEEADLVAVSTSNLVSPLTTWSIQPDAITIAGTAQVPAGTPPDVRTLVVERSVTIPTDASAGDLLRGAGFSGVELAAISDGLIRVPRIDVARWMDVWTVDHIGTVQSHLLELPVTLPGGGTLTRWLTGGVNTSAEYTVKYSDPSGKTWTNSQALCVEAECGISTLLHIHHADGKATSVMSTPSNLTLDPTTVNSKSVITSLELADPLASGRHVYIFTYSHDDEVEFVSGTKARTSHLLTTSGDGTGSIVDGF